MQVLVHQSIIESRIRDIAQQISNDHNASNHPEPPVLICVLNGAFMFFTELVKNLDIECEIDFVRMRSYEGQDNSKGVTLTKPIESNLSGKRVYIVEDIIDSGATMIALLQHVREHLPQTIKIVTLVKRSTSEPREDYYCVEVDDSWLVGYGFDDNGLKRNYKNIYKI